MALSARLQIRQSQSLVITPQLMQAIRLLQMSGVELERFIAGEIEQNPLLEREESAPGDAEQESGETQTELPEGVVDAEIALREIDAEKADAFPEEVGSGNWTASTGPGYGAVSAYTGDGDFDQIVAAPESLEALLERYIEAAFADSPSDRAIALSLLTGLDEAGYLSISLDILAQRLNVPLARVEGVLRGCQNLAPSGVFARGLAECLALQLAERNRLDPAMRTLLDNLPRLAERDYAGLCRFCGIDRDDLDEMIAEVRALDPKPGLAFARDTVRTLVPDVHVRAARDGGWAVELNDEALPRVLVNRAYHAVVSRSCGEADRRYLSDCLQKASWLEKSLDQRARTVLKVATEIVRRQEGFLSDGVAFLRPLNLRMVADALGVHESTVSRAAANKTMATPRGVFEFRYFFTGAISASAGGESHAAAAVKHRIRQLILAESPDAVLSDDAIVAILSAGGIEIARRTVAKYREGMRIGSSVERRRERRMRAAS